MSRGDSRYDDEPPKGTLRKFYAAMAAVPDIEKRIQQKRTFSWEYEVPYLAGSSEDGKKIYLDPKLRKLPKWAIQAVCFHEIIEWALKEKEPDYEKRHQMATAAEDQFVEYAGHTADSYRKLLRPYYKAIEQEEIDKAPPDLDLGPYTGKLKATLESFQDGKSAGKVSKTSVHYRKGTKAEHCGNCSMYLDHVCSLVRGYIEPEDTCDKWEAKK